MIVVPLYVPAVHPVGVWRTPLNATVADDDTVNPLPVTVYVAPTGPCVGKTVIAGTVTVNVRAVVEVLVATSVPTTLYGPADSLGTANVHANPPVEFVVIVVPLYVPAVHPVGVWRTPLNATVADDDTVNPLPVTVYVAPFGPWSGDSAIVGTVTVNVCAAVDTSVEFVPTTL